MRSLVIKLTLAFLLVGLTGAVLVAFFVRQRTQREFDRLIVDQNQQVLLTNLTRYYQVYRSWNGVETVFRPGSLETFPPPESQPRWEVRRSLFTIADDRGVVVFGGGPDHLGKPLSSGDLKKGEPLTVDGQTVGWLLFTPALDRWQAGTPEGNFLVSVNQATLLSALAATLVALVLGGILAYTMTRSLRELTAATQALARGELGHQVKVRSQDELGALARSFNQMSSELQRSYDLRRRMTADIAHDLRTPLSVILGYAEALSDGKLTASPEIFDVMHTEAQHLSHLIDDLKVLSLVDSGELPLTRQSIEAGELLRRTASSHQVQAQSKGIAIMVEAAPHVPPVEVDVERMAQVLGNLISNALRYTTAGGEIVLSVRGEGERVIMQVADNGEGIAEQDLPNIFERAFRSDKARVQHNGETGLGLAIAKSLVEAHGGAISVESAVGRGTTFTISLPASPNPA